MGVAATNHTLFATLHIEPLLLKFLEITADQGAPSLVVFDTCAKANTVRETSNITSKVSCEPYLISQIRLNHKRFDVALL